VLTLATLSSVRFSFARMIMEPGPVVFHTNLCKQLTVSDGGVVSSSTFLTPRQFSLLGMHAPVSVRRHTELSLKRTTQGIL
jgi:hypothetical protein